MKSMKFPKEYEQKVDFKNVKIEAMKPWIAKRVTDLLGIEDEVLVGYIYEQLEGKEVRRSFEVKAALSCNIVGGFDGWGSPKYT